MSATNVMSKVELVPLDSIKPYHRNPRKNDAAVPAVKESIKAFGFNQPIVVDGKGVIIVGHTRYRAAVELELAKVPIVRATHLSAKDAKAYRIADNKVAERASWDNALLVPELRATDLEMMGLFFDEADLSKLLAGAEREYRPVSAEDMDKAIDRFQEDGPGARAMNGHAEGMVKLECPHCGEDFMVKRGTIGER